MCPKQNFIVVLSLMFIFIASTFGSIVPFKNCGPAGVIHDVDIDPCEQEPCPLARGKIVKLKVNFTEPASAAPTQLKALAYGILIGQKVPYPLPNPDGCKGCGVKCPLQPGPRMYNSSITIPAGVPKIRLVIEWDLVDQDNNIVFCLQIPAVVTD